MGRPFYFFNKWQVRKLLETDAPFYPNKESRYETIDGVKLHYVCHGSGADILLLHGIAANIYCWRLLIPLLEKKFRVWAVDIKGFGLSDKPDDNYDLQSQADLLVKFARKHVMKNLTVVGSSMGGAIASEVAVQWRNQIAVRPAPRLGPFKFRPRPARPLVSTATLSTSQEGPFTLCDAAESTREPYYGPHNHSVRLRSTAHDYQR